MFYLIFSKIQANPDLQKDKLFEKTITIIRMFRTQDPASVFRVRQKRAFISQGGINGARKNLNWTVDQGILPFVISWGRSH